MYDEGATTNVVRGVVRLWTTDTILSETPRRLQV